MGNDKPPVLNLQVESYDAWKKKLNSWTVITDAPSKKWGHMIIYNCCDSKLQEELYAIDEDALIKDDGWLEVVKRLDVKFKVDDKLKQYLYFDEFIEFRREDDSEILQYIEEFERKAEKLKSVQCVIPDTVLAHTLVKNAGLSEEAKATIRATATDLTFDNVKESMLKVYSKTFGTKSTSHDYSDRPIKEECMYNNFGNSRGQYKPRGQNRSNRGRGLSRGGTYNDDRPSYSQNNHNNDSSGYKNPNDYNTGKPMRCFNCDADNHMSRRCPFPRKENKLGKRKRSYNDHEKKSFPTYYSENPDVDNTVEMNLVDLASPESL